MIALAWVMGSVVTYLLIGGEWTDWQKRATAAHGFAYFTMMSWPLRGPYLVTTRLADKHNPDLIARELRRREQAIADRELEIKELERRMKVGRDDS